jgi:UDP-N-acetylglucosamine 4,6-dehydratase
LVDLATAMAPGLGYEVVGIRPGEKIHEVMCPADDCHLTIEFPDHFVIAPTISFVGRDNEFGRNELGEEGRHVEQGFEYSSGRNSWFLTIPEIIETNRKAEAV